jgi:hypothetical protein
MSLTNSYMASFKLISVETICHRLRNSDSGFALICVYGTPGLGTDIEFTNSSVYFDVNDVRIKECSDGNPAFEIPGAHGV